MNHPLNHPLSDTTVGHDRDLYQPKEDDTYHHHHQQQQQQQQQHDVQSPPPCKINDTVAVVVTPPPKLSSRRRYFLTSPDECIPQMPEQEQQPPPEHSILEQQLQNDICSKALVPTLNDKERFMLHHMALAFAKRCICSDRPLEQKEWLQLLQQMQDKINKYIADQIRHRQTRKDAAVTANDVPTANKFHQELLQLDRVTSTTEEQHTFLCQLANACSYMLVLPQPGPMGPHKWYQNFEYALQLARMGPVLHEDCDDVHHTTISTTTTTDTHPNEVIAKHKINHNHLHNNDEDDDDEGDVHPNKSQSTPSSSNQSHQENGVAVPPTAIAKTASRQPRKRQRWATTTTGEETSQP